MNKEIKLTARNRWCYSIGGLRDVMYTFVSMFLLVYIQYTVPLTDAQFAVIGLIMTLCKVWDAINDPMMGTIIENSRLKSGKFRPWILIGAITSSIITALMFLIRMNDGWSYVIFIGVMYLLWGMTFTMNDVGYWSMLPSLGQNARDRDSITTQMAVFVSISAFAVAAVVPMMTGTDKVVRYGLSAIVVVAVFLASQLLTFLGVKEPKRSETEKGEKINLGRMFSIIKNNDQLIWVAVALCCYYLGSGLLLQFGMNFCYFEYGYAKGGSIYTVFAVVYLLATLLSQLVFPGLAKHISRKTLITVGVILSAAGYIVLMLFGFVLPKDILYICISGALIFGGQNFINLIILVQMTNTIEYNELKTGQKNESIIFSLRSFLAKLTGALQTLTVAAVLIVSGIKSSTDNIAALEEQLGKELIDSETVVSKAEEIISSSPDSARLILRICMVAIPTVLLIICAIVDRAKYKITEVKYEEIMAELEARHSAAELSPSESTEDAAAMELAEAEPVTEPTPAEETAAE